MTWPSIKNTIKEKKQETIKQYVSPLLMIQRRTRVVLIGYSRLYIKETRNLDSLLLGLLREMYNICEG